MCGIVAIHSFNGTIDGNRLSNAINSLAHRGPEGSKIWISANQNTGLAHARLSIIDLPTGAQPITNETEKIHIIVNGEFYDFERIRIECEKKGHVFRTKSDSEIALHLYEEMGAACLSKLRGEFAFVLWDEESQVLLAARDRFGIKPLYYSIFDGKIYLASEVKALFAAGIPAQWDLSSINMSFPHKTLYKNVYQIPPGHYLQMVRGDYQTYKYWDFNYPRVNSKAFHAHSLEETVHLFKAELEESIRLRLRADVPVGVYLSGGIDSCALLGMASHLAGKPLAAFNLSFDNAQYDESGIAKEMAEHVGASLETIPISQQDIIDNFAKTIWHAEQGIINSNSVAKFILSGLVNKAGYKTVLTGEGSDEILAGYPSFRMDVLQQLKNLADTNIDQLTKDQQNLIEKNKASLGLLLASNQVDPKNFQSLIELIGFVPSWLGVNSEFARNHMSLFADRISKKMAISPSNYFKLYLNHFDIEGQLQGRDVLNKSLYLWSKMLFAQYLLTVLADRMEMAHSVEGRVPFLDHHLVEFMRDVPTQYKLYNMNEKYLLREAAKPYITKTVYERQKHPFLAPPALASKDGLLFGYINEVLRSSKLPGFYDRAKVTAFLDSIPKLDPKMGAVIDPVLMMVLSNCLLQDQFKLS